MNSEQMAVQMKSKKIRHRCINYINLIVKGLNPGVISKVG